MSAAAHLKRSVITEGMICSLTSIMSWPLTTITYRLSTCRAVWHCSVVDVINNTDWVAVSSRCWLKYSNQSINQYCVLIFHINDRWFTTHTLRVWICLLILSTTFCSNLTRWGYELVVGIMRVPSRENFMELHYGFRIAWIVGRTAKMYSTSQ